MDGEVHKEGLYDRYSIILLNMSDQEDFQKGDSGAGLTYPCPCNDIKKGGHIMMKEKPCKVSEISVYIYSI